VAELTRLVKGMTCEHCAMAVRKALEALPEEEKAAVDLEAGLVMITTGQKLPDDEILAEAVRVAGYELQRA